MRITDIGHAGLYVQTAYGSILCDPWFTPAYFASWFPFPANDGIDPVTIGSPDYLFVSHLHRDHYDPDFLRAHVSKDATVLLPQFPLPDLRHALEDLGFHSFVQTQTNEPFELDGLRLMVVALTAPTDGPIGDSCLCVDDGTATILDQNDARPPDLDALSRFGAYDAHFLQFSGAIWYPMVYDLPDKAKVALGKQKRANGLDRAWRYVEALGARFVVPHAGPPAFLDDDLFELNDLGQPGNAFPDTPVFLDYLTANGHRNGVLTVPGSTVEITRDGLTVTHPMPDAEVNAIHTRKREYLEAYRDRMRPALAAERASRATGDDPLLPVLADWWNPLLAQGQHLAARVGDRLLVQTEREKLVVDFVAQAVVPYDGQDCRFSFTVADDLLRTCVRDRDDDWVNRLFLSCRFTAHRSGPYNEGVYTFFKALRPDKMAYVEQWLSTEHEVRELWRFGDHLVQRRCPHLQADLARFGSCADGVLTCEMHGWQFDLATGECLTTDDPTIRLLSRSVAAD